MTSALSWLDKGFNVCVLCVYKIRCVEHIKARGWSLLMHEAAVFQLITDLICHVRSLLKSL